MNNIERAINFLEYIKKNIPSLSAYEIPINTAITALEAQQADRWIPITSGVLPEDRGYPPVICCNTEDKWTDAAFVSTHGHFINCEGVIIHPTHWKPLPISFKEEQPL